MVTISWTVWTMVQRWQNLIHLDAVMTHQLKTAGTLMGNCTPLSIYSDARDIVILSVFAHTSWHARMTVVGRKIVLKPLQEIPGICKCVIVIGWGLNVIIVKILLSAVEHLKEEVFAAHGVIEEYLAYDHMWGYVTSSPILFSCLGELCIATLYYD